MRAVMVFVLLAACIDDSLVPCGDQLCPTSSTCTDTGCVSDEQIAACVGLESDAVCDLGVGVGVCLDGVCVLGRCGNGRIDASEACDDGNASDGDGCSRDCRSDESCGNGIRDSGEECDGGDANADSPDAICRTTCVLAGCGDAIVDVGNGEACDAGSGNSGAADAACRTNCQPRRCSDGVVDVGAGEACDDGNVVPGDGCSFDCLSSEVCGNGFVDYFDGETCDDGNATSYDGCSRTCNPDAPPIWARLDEDLSPRMSAAMAYDAARRRVVLFGGRDYTTDVMADTWEWDGASWLQRAPVSSPSARRGAVMAYDQARMRIVLFGGHDIEGSLGDTWEWNGIDWTRVATSGPSPRWGSAMTYDAARKRVVLFGGLRDDLNNTLDDTWEWDGSSWALRSPQDRPGSRFLHAAAYDPARGRTVVFGGRAYGSTFEDYVDTWEWDGTNWEDVTPAAPQGERTHLAMAYDPALGVVRFGGYRDGGPEHDMAAWNGTTWTPIDGTSALPRTDHAMAYDSYRAELVLVGGDARDSSGPVTPATSTWNGSTWTSRGMPSVGFGGSTSAFDSRRGVLVVWKSGEFLEWKDGAWTTFPGPTLSNAAMAYDSVRGVMVLVGDASYEEPVTLTWDGEEWATVTTTTATPYVHGFNNRSLVFDAARNRMVYVGVESFASEDFQTWEFDGTDWELLEPATVPPNRFGPVLAYDEARQVTILFGGTTNQWERNPTVNDTWEWNGTTWAERTPASSPPGRTLHAMAYDSHRERIILFGGQHAYTAKQDTWEWDGATWHAIAPAALPPRIDEHAMAYDPIRRRVIVTANVAAWTFAWEGDVLDTCTGHDIDLDSATGCADSDCAAQCTACGNNVCDDLEDCRSCTSDCGACSALCGDSYCDAPETVTSCPGDCTP